MANETVSSQADEKPRIEQASRAIAWNGVLSITTTIFAVAVSIGTARLLTKPQMGLFSFASQWLRYVSILVLFTLDTALMRYIPAFQARGDRRGLWNLVIKVIGIHVVVWCVIALGVLLAVLDFSPSLRALFIVGVAVALPSVLYVSLQAVLTSFLAMRIQVFATVIGGCLQLMLLWVFIHILRWEGVGAMVAQLGMSGLLLLVFTVSVLRLKIPPQTGSYEPFPIRRLLWFSFPYAVNRVANEVFGRQSEVFFLKPYYGEVAVATYSVAYQAAQRCVEFVPLVFYGVGSVLAASAFIEGRDRLARVMNIYWRILALLVAAISIGGCALADKFTVLLYGAKYTDAGGYAAVLFVAQALVVFLNPFYFVMRAEEKTWITFWLAPPAAIISLGIDYLLIPKFGLNGALAATCSSFILVTMLQHAVFRRMFPYLDVPWGYVARCYMASLPMLLSFFVKDLLPGNYGFMLGAAAAFGLWVLGVRTMGLVGEQEADLIKRSKLPGAALLLKALTK